MKEREFWVRGHCRLVFIMRVLADITGRSSINALVFVDLEDETEPLRIAIKEFNQKKVPWIIRRYLPDGW